MLFFRVVIMQIKARHPLRQTVLSPSDLRPAGVDADRWN
uniref:Uncharacterized protein n=1 Tax=Anguilla anguilla TaxID=7936 RepID=A0A0E9TMZ9_ANGAN